MPRRKPSKGNNMPIDFRSDTVTRPTDAMLERMQNAPVGDAVLGDDPTVLELEAHVAGLFGKEAALFCPSGTMTNQIAIKVHTQPGDQMICDQTAHVYVYEGGGAALHSGITCKLLDGDLGRFTAEQVKAAISPDDPHYPRSRLVSIENTSNKGGGTCWDPAEIERIRDVCTAHRLRLHLDGARLFNALVATGDAPTRYGSLFDSISVCLSKGLGAPVGSLLLGSKDFIASAARMRKAFGGAMRQAGYLAAAGLFALEHNVDRLRIDHAHARQLGAALAASKLPGRARPVATNIVMFDFETPDGLRSTLDAFAGHGILAAPMGDTLLRMVTHQDITSSMIEQTVDVVQGLG